MGPEGEKITSNGIFYTPDEVASYLATEAFKHLPQKKMRVLDPSCGDGALLRAAANACNNTQSKATRFVGCDLFQPLSWPHDQRFTLHQCDFFDLPTTSRFDVIITNPPYIQYGKLKADKRERYYNTLAKPQKLPKNIDLWTYFLLKSLDHLKTDGAVAAVVPWSLIEAKYSHGFRQFLIDKFRSIRVLVLRDRHFDSTEKRVLLLWLKGFGQPTRKIEIAFSDTVTDQHKFTNITKDEWTSSNLLPTHGLDIENKLQAIKGIGFRPLSDYADVSIGVVTGANRFFIVPAQKAVQLGFSKISTTPILTHVDELSGLAFKSSPERVLLRFSRMTEKRRKYLRRGIRTKIHKASHCQRRIAHKNQWYNVSEGPVPDAFFTYRVSQIPFMVLNPRRHQCTNTLHKVCFKPKVNKNAQKWIQLSLLSDAGQLSLEAGARHYGNGILKVEPHLLKDAMVLACNEPIPTHIYKMVSDAMADGRKEDASAIATEAIRNVTCGSETLWANISMCIQSMRCRRNGTENQDVLWQTDTSCDRYAVAL